MNDYDYTLPAALIAEFPTAARHDSRMLVFKNGQIDDAMFQDTVELLPPGSLLVLNNSRVIEARIRLQKATGGQIEIFCLEPADPLQGVGQALEQTASVLWKCLVGGASKWKQGQILKKQFGPASDPSFLSATLKEKVDDGCIIEFSWTNSAPFSEILRQVGTIPLPPYIKREVQTDDSSRYQTVFSSPKGSVAAPTAALHFTEPLLQSLAAKGVMPAYLTLHVGAGTFKPVKVNDISLHQMHGEPFTVSKALLEMLRTASLIIAAGTTSLRTLESLYWIAIRLKNGNSDLELTQWEAYNLPDEDVTYGESMEILAAHMEATGKTELHCRTSLLIKPGYRFRSAKGLITNFHQPRSTLLLLVAAFVGPDWKKIYNHALGNGYRFLSYGDSSLLWRRD